MVKCPPNGQLGKLPGHLLDLRAQLWMSRASRSETVRFGSPGRDKWTQDDGDVNSRSRTEGCRTLELASAGREHD
jgi:hypothetical protein